MNRARVVSVVSGKGGVGKTTTVSNLGISLVTEFGKKVLVIDGNVTTSNLGMHLGFIRPPVSLQDVLDGTIKSNKAVFVHESGLHVIPASLAVDSIADYDKMKNVVNRLRPNYDFILLDSAAGVDEEVEATVMASDESAVVTVPEIPTVITAVKMVSVIRRLKQPVRGIIVNRIKNETYEVPLGEIESSCGAPIVGVIPEDRGVPVSLSVRKPLIFVAPQSPAAVAFRTLASSLVGERVEKTKESVLNRLIASIASPFRPRPKATVHELKRLKSHSLED